jgi:hypothetical protein
VRPGPRAGATLLVAALLGGCAGVGSAPDGARRLPLGVVLVLPRTVEASNRAVAVEAAARLVGALRHRGDVVGLADVLGRAQAAGLAPRVARLADQIEQGGWPDAGEASELLEPAGVTAVLAVQVTAYEQVWGGSGKSTRVRLEAHAFDLRTREVAWIARGSAAVEQERGRAFRLALEHAVADLAQAIQPGSLPGPYHPVVRALWPWAGSRAW